MKILLAKTKMKKLIVSLLDSGIRLDAYLVKYLDGKSRSYAQKVIEEKKCLVNSKLSKDSYKVRENDVVEFELLDEKP